MSHLVKSTRHISQSLWVAVIIIGISSGISFIYWNNNFWNPVFKLVGFGVLAYVVTHRLRCEMYFKWLVWTLSLYPFISIFTSAVEYGQSPLISIRTLLINLIWLFYFVFHKQRLSEKVLIRALLLYALMVVSIQVIQQFSYPLAYFGVDSPEEMYRKGVSENVSMRNGLYRFRIGENGYITVLVLLYYIQKIKVQLSMNHIFVISLMIISVYMTLTRQVMVCTLFVLALSFLQKNKGRHTLLFLAVCAITLIGFSYYDELFGELGESTENDLNDENIRIFAYVFYIDKILQDGITFLFGNGMPGISGPYRKLVDVWQLDYHYWPVDVGVIGFWFYYGFVYIALFAYCNYVLLIRYRKQVPSYLWLTVLYTLPMSIMIFPFWGQFCYFYWAIILYLYDLHIRNYQLTNGKNKQILHTNPSL